LLPEVATEITEDQNLLARIREGEHAAFAELYACHKQGVYLYCTRFIGRTPAAEDIFQDVFLNFLEQIRNGKCITNVKGYLLSSAHNRCLNWIRNKKYPAALDTVPETPSNEGLPFGEQLDLDQALQKLTHEYREPLLLREYEGYKYGEIAALLKLPVTTVRMRIFRARQMLRAYLEPNQGVE